MKALTILQPWASLIACGAKKIETRSWPTKYRGPIAIHAAKKNPCRLPLLGMEKFEKVAKEALEKAGLTWCFLPTGCVIAIAELVDCRPAESYVFGGTLRDISENEIIFGDYTPGRYAWILENIRPIEPVPAKGQQRLWEWPVEKWRDDNG